MRERMMPERLFRHENPPDHIVVTWGDMRSAGGALAGRFRRSLAAVMVGLALLTLAVVGGGVILGLVIANTNHNQRASETAVCGVAAYAIKQADNIAQAAKKVAPGPMRRNLLQRSAELDQLADQMRATGIRCPPPGK